jgi:hypothetical protein
MKEKTGEEGFDRSNVMVGKGTRYLCWVKEKTTVCVDGVPLQTVSQKRCLSVFSMRYLTKGVSTDRSW